MHLTLDQRLVAVFDFAVSLPVIRLQLRLLEIVPTNSTVILALSRRPGRKRGKGDSRSSWGATFGCARQSRQHLQAPRGSEPSCALVLLAQQLCAGRQCRGWHWSLGTSIQYSGERAIQLGDVRDAS